mgnify:CR=1 FL=1
MVHRTRWQHGGLKILPHGSLKTRGEPCGVREKWRCGVMTALPRATDNIPIVRGAWQIWRNYLNKNKGSCTRQFIMWLRINFQSCSCLFRYRLILQRILLWSIGLYLNHAIYCRRNQWEPQILFCQWCGWEAITNRHRGRRAIRTLWYRRKVASAKEVTEIETLLNDKKVYDVEDIQKLLGIGRSKAYAFLDEAYQKQEPFRVIKIGKLFRVPKQSFDNWLDKID